MYLFKVDHDVTSLHEASHKGETQKVVALLDHFSTKQTFQQLSKRLRSGSTSIHLASHGGHSEAVRALLAGLQPEQRFTLLCSKNNDGDTALHIASREEFTETLNILLGSLIGWQAYHLVCVENKSCLNAFQIASRNRSKTVMNALHSHLTKKQQFQFLTIFVSIAHNLTDAAFKGDAAFVTELLDKLSLENKIKLFYAGGFSGETVIHNCYQHFKTMMIVLDHLSPTQKHHLVIAAQDQNGQTVLHRASRKGDTKSVRAILKDLRQCQMYSLLTTPDVHHETAFHMMSFYGHSETVEAIFDLFGHHDHGFCYRLVAELDFVQRSCLHMVSFNGHINTMEVLMKHVSPEPLRYTALMKQDIDGHTPNHIASQNGQPKIVTTILEYLSTGQRCSLLLIRDYNMRTALHTAVENGHSSSVKALLGFNLQLEQRYQIVSAQDNLNRTVLHLASDKGNKDIVMNVLEWTPCSKWHMLIGTKDSDSETALHKAAFGDHMSVIKVLLKHFTEEEKRKLLSIRNNHGQTALDISNRNRFVHIVCTNSLNGRWVKQQPTNTQACE